MDAQKLERRIWDMEQEEDERTLYLEDSFAFLAEQADSILQVDLRDAMREEAAKNNRPSARLTSRISDFQVLLEQSIAKVCGTTDSCAASTASPASTAGSLGCLSDVEDSPVAAYEDNDVFAQLQMVSAEAPCVREASDGAPSSDAPSSGATMAVTQLLVQMMPAWQMGSVERPGPAASMAQLPQGFGSVANIQDGAAASFELASRMVYGWRELWPVTPSLKTAESLPQVSWTAPYFKAPLP